MLKIIRGVCMGYILKYLRNIILVSLFIAFIPISVEIAHSYEYSNIGPNFNIGGRPPASTDLTEIAILNKNLDVSAYNPNHGVMEDVHKTELYNGSFRSIGNISLNSTFNFIFTLDTIADAPNTTIKLILPDGIELVSGDLVWSGDIKKSELIERNIFIKPVKEGEFRLKAWVENDKFRGYDQAFISYINVTLGKLQEKPSEVASPMPMGGKVAYNPPVSEINKSLTSEKGFAVVYGYYKYEGDDGLQYPIKNAKAELWKANPSGIPDEMLSVSNTDESGKFNFQINIPGNINVYVNLYLEDKDGIICRCTDGSGSIWWDQIPNFGVSKTISVGNNDLGTHVGLLEVYQAYDYVSYTYNWFNNFGYKRPEVIVKWPYDVWPQSTGNEIWLPYKRIGNNHWDRYVLYHEYAHCIMYNIYNLMPGGCYVDPHFINSESCEGFAFTEGWAEFIAGAVDNDPGNVADTTCNKLTNIEDNNWQLGKSSCNAINKGAEIEGAVASILWDIFDSNNYPNEPNDKDYLSRGFGPIFLIIRNHKPGSINEFYNYWIQDNGDKSSLDWIFRSHGIEKVTGLTVTNDGGASLVTTSSARLNGEITDTGNENPTVHICWGRSDGGTGSWEHDENLGTKGQGIFSKDISGLTSGAPYYYRCYASNSAGTSWAGITAQFSTTSGVNRRPNTPSIPSGPTAGITGVSYPFSTSAIDPDGDQIKYIFDWGDGTTTTTNLVSSGTIATVSHSWSRGTWDVASFFVRTEAIDSHGVTSEMWSNPLRVEITPSLIAPSITNSNGATLITANSARLNGEITDTGGEHPMVTIYWGRTDGGTSAGSWDYHLGLGPFGRQVFSADISSLTPGTLYYYRCYAYNSAGSSWASKTSAFASTVLITKPTVTNDGGASSITSNSARLYGEITDIGGEDPEVHICWGLGDSGTGSWSHDENLGVKPARTFYKDISGLVSGKTYYYRCYASNSAGSSWTSSSTSFTTINSVPSTPSMPSGPVSGFAGNSYPYSTSAIDPDGDQVKYTFDWGDGTNIDTGFVTSGTSSSASHSWSSAGTYQVKANAMDSNSATSEWSNLLAVTIQSNKLPNVPGKPSGSSTGVAGSSYSYSASAKDPDGDQVKYVFDWGDGTTSETAYVRSSAKASASHVWDNAGTYLVKAKAVDSKGAPSSIWSSSLSVKVNPNKPPNAPGKPSGSTKGYAWASYSYSTSAKDPDGDQVKYTLDWGDGITSDTILVKSGAKASASHIWGSAGTYLVKAIATDRKGESSGPSSALTVTILANNPPGVPNAPSGPISGKIKKTYSYTASSVDSDGDKVKLTFDWGDGTTSTTSLVKSGMSASSSHRWSKTGTYQVKSMATDSKGGSSGWSGQLEVIIS
jgi:hypothetical protein